jgi:hypothetical protein
MLMEQIHGQTSRVRAWLGQEADDSPVLFCYFNGTDHAVWERRCRPDSRLANVEAAFIA